MHEIVAYQFQIGPTQFGMFQKALENTFKLKWLTLVGIS